MSRILLPLAIVGAVLAQVPTADWKDLSALGFMGATLILLVVRILPAKDAQVIQLVTTFAETVRAGQDKTALVVEKSSALMTEALANLSSQHERALETGKELAKAIGETGQVLAGLQLHCARQAAGGNP